MDDLPLAAEFPAATREQWLARVEGVLKGASFDRTLTASTYDDLRIEPLYPKAGSRPPATRPRAGPWRVSQRVDHPDPAIANALALADLEGGADALTLVGKEASSARGFGVDLLSDLEPVLSGIIPDLVHLRLDAGNQGWEAAERLTSLLTRHGHALASLSLDLDIDPIGLLARTGEPPGPWATITNRCAETFGDLTARGFTGRAFLADGRPYHEAGASEAQELAAVLSTALAFWRGLEAGGHALDAGRDALSFLLVADADEFLTIAKFRALRRLWARIEAACGLAPKPIHLHAETAWRMTTRRDPWVNLLRTTLAAFAAGIGGADGVTVLPFTAALGLPDAFARRMARNMQLILIKEAHLGHVADPAAGSGGIEALTDALCEKAWSLFQEIEREGGIVESLRKGGLQARIATVRTRRAEATATRKDPITGTSAFANLSEGDVSVLLPFPAPSRESDETALALPSLRLAEPFERLRDRSDAHLEQTGQRPRIFLANLGPAPAFTARAAFAQNLFEAGGIEAVVNDGFASVEDLAKAYRASGSALACLCSSDEVYETEAVPAAEALREAGADRVYLAGRPGDREAELRQAGVTDFIAAGVNSLALLEEALTAAIASGFGRGVS